MVYAPDAVRPSLRECGSSMRTDLYFGFRWQLHHRGMRYRRFLALNRLSHILMERMCRKLPYCWIPIADLAYLETRTFPERLESVRDGWEKTREIPIMLYDHPDGRQLWNGNHRLTTVRAMGAEAVKAVILPFNLPYTRAVDRERAALEDLMRQDGQLGPASVLLRSQAISRG